MISNKIKILAKQKKLSLKEISEKIGMSDTGFLQALKRDDFKTSTLEKLSKYFHVPLLYWFKEQDRPENKISESNSEYTKPCPNCRHLEKEIELQQEIIDYLKRELQLKKKEK